MNAFYLQAASYLPQPLRRAAERVEPAVQERVHELRLRRGRPLTLSAADGEWWVTLRGEVTAARQPGLTLCRQEELDECLLRLCGYSVHTHEEELRQGFVCTDSGCRAGLGGTVVTENGQATAMRQLTSVCLRVARPHEGCAAPLLPYLCPDGVPCSAVLCGAPSSGKTSLLRDAARQLAAGEAGRRLRVAVADERGELALGETLADCDVLTGCRKAEGIVRAVRCLAPDVLVFDEWGGAEECRAVEEALRCGVAVLTSCHAGSLRELWQRPAVSRVLRTGGIRELFLLAGYRHAGQIACHREAGDWIAENHRLDMCGGIGDRGRGVCGPPPAPASEGAGGAAAAAELYRQPYPLYGGTGTDGTARGGGQRRGGTDAFAAGGRLCAGAAVRRVGAGGTELCSRGGTLPGGDGAAHGVRESVWEKRPAEPVRGGGPV